MDSKVSFFLQIFWKIFWHQLIRNSEDETSSSLETFSLKPNPPSSLLISVTRLGEFSKFLTTNFFTKVAQIFGNNLGNFTVYHIFRKSCFGYFLGNIGKLGLLLIPISGHTASDASEQRCSNGGHLF